MRPGVALCPKYNDHSPIPPGQAFKTLLSVSNAIILSGHHLRVECATQQRKINTMLFQVGLALGFVVGDHNANCNNNYPTCQSNCNTF